MLVYFFVLVAVGMFDYILCYLLYRTVSVMLKDKGMELPKIESGRATIIIVCVAMCFNMVVLHGLFPYFDITPESFHVSEHLE